MKFAFFSTMAGQPWGGSEELWSRTAKELLARRHAVGFSVLQWQDRPRQIAELIEAGAQPHFRRRWRMGRSLRSTLQKLRLSRKRYSSWLQKTRPDFVVISFACHTDDPQIAVSCASLNIPYAIVLQAAGCHSWIDPRSLNDYQQAYSRATAVYFVSQNNREIVETNLAMKLPNAAIVDNPFTIACEPIAFPQAGPPWNLACVARVHFPTKGQDLIARVMSMPKWQDRPLHVSLWGSDNGSLNQMRQLMELYKLEPRVRYAGVSQDVAQIWRDNHALLLPSRAEGNSLSLIEAMMCGRVAITTNVGRAAELIDNNKSGFVAPAATVELIDDALERAWAKRFEWEMMGKRAAENMKSRHGTQPEVDFADRLIAVANTVLSHASVT